MVSLLYTLHIAAFSAFKVEFSINRCSFCSRKCLLGHCREITACFSSTKLKLQHLHFSLQLDISLSLSLSLLSASHFSRSFRSHSLYVVCKTCITTRLCLVFPNFLTYLSLIYFHLFEQSPLTTSRLQYHPAKQTNNKCMYF